MAKNLTDAINRENVTSTGIRVKALRLSRGITFYGSDKESVEEIYLPLLDRAMNKMPEDGREEIRNRMKRLQIRYDIAA